MESLNISSKINNATQYKSIRKMTTVQPAPFIAALSNTGITVKSQKRLMYGHARCTATANEMISIINVNIKAKKSECFGMMHEAMATTLCQSNSRAPHSVRVPMKTQRLKLMALTVYSKSVSSLSIGGGKCVLKKSLFSFIHGY